MSDDETTREVGDPTGDMHLQYLKQLAAMEVASMVNSAIGEMV